MDLLKPHKLKQGDTVGINGVGPIEDSDAKGRFFLGLGHCYHKI